MKIIKAGTFGFYDVFTGNGWYHHTRVQFHKKSGTLKFVTGNHLSPNQVKHVMETINGRP